MSDWLIPYLMFNGNCEEAVNFYQKVLGGEARIMHYGDAPANPNFPVSEEVKNLVLHAQLTKDNHTIRFSDIFPGSEYTVGNNITFALEFDTTEETQAIFEALSEGGQVHMPPQQTFFSPLFAKFADKFGIVWQINTAKK